MVKKAYYGELYYEAVNQFINKEIREAVKKENLVSVGNTVITSMNHNPEGGVDMSVTITILPRIKLEKLENFSFKIPSEKPTEEEFKAWMESKYLPESDKARENKEDTLFLDDKKARELGFESLDELNKHERELLAVKKRNGPKGPSTSR